MAKPRKDVVPTIPKEVAPIGVSSFYAIKKYGLYAYQVVMMTEQGEVTVGVANVYGVVASDLIDLMFGEINEGKK